MPKHRKRIQRNRLRFVEPADRSPAQFGDMPDRAERLREVAGKRADIGPFADRRLELGMVRIRQVRKAQRHDLDGTRGERHSLAATREVIGALARHLESGEGWRPLREPRSG